MSDRDEGGPAFARPSTAQCTGHPGMSLRDWFAGQALAGMSASDMRTTRSDDYIATRAYELADALIAARKGPRA